MLLICSIGHFIVEPHPEESDCVRIFSPFDEDINRLAGAVEGFSGIPMEIEVKTDRPWYFSMDLPAMTWGRIMEAIGSNIPEMGAIDSIMENYEPEQARASYVEACKAIIQAQIQAFDPRQMIE